MKLRPKLDKLWQDAIKANREAQWCYLPEKISDFVECIDKLAESEIKFLCLKAISFERYNETQAAIRTLGLIYEYQKESIITMIFKYLLSLKTHPLRHFVLEGIWSSEISGFVSLLSKEEQDKYHLWE